MPHDNDTHHDSGNPDGNGFARAEWHDDEPAAARRPRRRRRGDGMKYLLPPFILLLLLAAIFGWSDEVRGRFFGFDRAGMQAHKMRQIEDLVHRYYYRTDWKEEDLYDQALHSMVEQLNDRYTQYYNAEEYEEFSRHTWGTFAGIGITLNRGEHGYPRVVTPYPDTPAWNVGIRPGDEFLLIDGKDPSKAEPPPDKPEMTPQELFTEVIVGQWLRGQAGQPLELRLRDRDGNERDVTLQRADVKIPSVPPGKMLTDPRVAGKGVGYVRVLQFQSSTAKDFLSAVNDLRSQGLKQLIVDIRFNPGGLLSEVRELVGLFLEPGSLVLRTDGPDGLAYRASDANAGSLRDLGLVLLVNRSSASASEIMAGALQDYQRAVVIGEVTFGKGLVQNVYPVGTGKSAIKITISRYFTPSGRVIQRDNSESMCPTCNRIYRATDLRRYCEVDGTRLVDDVAERWRGGINPDVRLDMTDAEIGGLRESLSYMEIYDDRPARPGDPAPPPFNDRQLDAAIRSLSGHALPQNAAPVVWPAQQ
ncbi:MAG: S41 family peptidase [Planctomycetota bacterium]